jgi:hypothetical protein
MIAETARGETNAEEVTIGIHRTSEDHRIRGDLQV